MANEDYTTIQDLVGPRRVKTKEVEIEAHDPNKIQELVERRGIKPVLFSQFPGNKVVPKNNCYCAEPEDLD